MYLRMGWVLGQVGLIGTIAIITLSSAITFFTGLSISSMATNMRVEGGGAYYIISRSFGVEAGAAIGIPLFFAQSLGIAFYISGFTESIIQTVPWIPELYLKLLVCLALGFTAYRSTTLALKTQGIILTVIGLSLISFLMGTSSEPMIPIESLSNPGPKLNADFWVVFAVFFPAVTGIEAGLSMSGELKNPAKSLPLGTLAAVVTGFLVYIMIAVLLFMSNASNESLIDNPMIMQDLSAIPFLILLGLWGSTLSSALGALMGAPRTLQALAKDRVIFPFFSKGEGEEDIPKRATIFSVVLASAVFFLGDLNAIASVLSMFFLTSYGFLNLAAAVEEMMGNPSWRPTFRINFVLSLLGAFGCLAAMLMINPGATFIATALVFSLYVATKKRKLGRHWSDVRRGVLLTLARQIVYKLELMEPDARTWRPHIFALTGSPKNRWPIIQLAHTLTLSNGFLTVGAVFENNKTNNAKPTQDMERSVRDFLRRNGIKALVSIHSAERMWDNMHSFVRGYGLGTLKPNTLAMGCSENDEHIDQYIKLLRNNFFLGKNLLLLRHSHGESRDDVSHPSDIFSARRIDIWWGRERQNANLMLALAHLIQQANQNQVKTDIFLKTTIQFEEERPNAELALGKFISDGRLNLKPEVYLLDQRRTPFEIIQEKSEGADLVFLGMKSPEAEESLESYKIYYEGLIKKTENMPQTAFILAAEKIDFKEIFE